MRRPPHVGPGEVGVARRMEHDMRHHAVGPLAFHQAGELAPRARLVEGDPAERAERRVPIPLVGIEPAGRHRVAAAIIVAQDRLRGCDMSVMRHLPVRGPTPDQSRPVATAPA